MKYSKKKYLDYLVRTIEALHSPENQSHFFINNPGFGNIFDILKNDAYRAQLIRILEKYYGEEYTNTIIGSLKKGSLNSFYTPEPIIDAISHYLKNPRVLYS